MKLSYKKFTPSGLLMINENYVLIPEGLHIYKHNMLRDYSTPAGVVSLAK
jgi:hypothetical protein